MSRKNAPDVPAAHGDDHVGAPDATLQQHAKEIALLGRPAARRVLDVVTDDPRTAQEIADALGLHHSGVRKQLAALVEAGLVEVMVDAPSGRGRPGSRYTRAPDEDARASEGHRELVRLLLGLVHRMGLGPDDMEQFGQGQGATMAVPGAGVDELAATFRRLGFAPRSVPGESPALDNVVLDRCPFAPGVEAPGGTLICVLHRGLARGILERAAPDVHLAELVEEDPRRAGCLLRLTREPDAA